MEKRPDATDVRINMFIKEISIKNFRLFKDTEDFKILNFTVPDNINFGSGLNIFVGENGCGKTSILDALSLPMLTYKADNINISDFFNIENVIKIEILADNNFEYDGTVPRIRYKSKGFEFEAKVRSRGNSAYLSSVVVSDQRFIRADGEDKPEDGKPDLRLKVDNPWKGSRFTENDILYLDKNRLFQVRSGTYNTTRFDRLMEDYNYKHLKENSPIEDSDKEYIDKILTFENSFLKSAFDKFEQICGEKIDLNLIDNYSPFKNAFFGYKKENSQQIAINNIGSGFEMIFTLLYSFYLSQQSNKKLILLIDEPELHLHPKLQEQFADLLLEFSKDVQIFLTTHSPLLIKQILNNDRALVKVLIKENNNVKESDPKERKLSYVSANEINFVAFQLPTEEYHNELYEELFVRNASRSGIKNFDIDYFQNTKSELPNYSWRGSSNEISLHTYVRNQIHHRAECGTASMSNIKTSIDTMRGFL